MSIAPGTRFGPYEVLSPLGAGGMGEVYRARDATLGRLVALKLLPETVAYDEGRVARFRREAQFLAALNHPQIGSIYGLEVCRGVPALVLELVEGPTLEKELTAGPLPLDRGLDVARQVALALEAAHELGIVHRDLKPANIKLRPDGTVKVLDFGLAKALGPAGDSEDSGSAATQTSPALTRIGAIVGTVTYMSPEQARGHEVDRGADIWAFGAVLYEMLAGSRAFSGASTAETIAAVLDAEPDWSRLPREAPESVRRVLRRCLSKDRRRRLADIRDARLDIEEAQGGGAIEPVAAATRRPRPWLAALGTLVLAAAAWTGARGLRPAARPPERRLEVTTPPTLVPVSLALSPQGDMVAFVALSEGRSLLWVRSLETGLAQPLRGTDGASLPFWSPDGRSIGFFSGERIRRIGLDGDQPKVLGHALVGAGATWSREGVILYPVGPYATLLRGSENGGPPTPLAGFEEGVGGSRPPGERFPEFLPDGRHFLYYRADTRGVFLGTLDGTERRHLLDADAAALFAPPGEILFVRNRVLYAQAFDSSRLQVEGEPVSLAEGVVVNALGAAAVSASAEGSIAYRTGVADEFRQLTWFDRSGARLGTVGDADAAGPLNPSLAPDGQRVVLSRTVGGNTDVWVMDVERGIASRFTDAPGPDITPSWSPDGGSVLYSGSMKPPTPFSPVVKSTVTEAEATVVWEATAQPMIAMDWSRDGRFVICRTTTLKDWDIWAIPMQGDGEPVPVLQEEFDERGAQFSPDGRWIAFESNRSGDYEVYLYPFPGPGPSTRVSNAGGAQPRWRRDGAELFYVAPDSRLMAVSVELPARGLDLSVGTPRPLFSMRVTSTVQGDVTHEYDVSADGQRFLVNAIVEQPTAPISLVLNRASLR